MTDDSRPTLDDILRHLAQAEARARPLPSDTLTARILADAAAAGGRLAPVRRRRSLLSAVRAALVWPTLRPAGLAAAMAACLLVGLGLGYGLESGPVVLADVAAGPDDTAFADDDLFLLASAPF